MGNWEIASHLLRRDGYRLLLYVGIKYKEQMERLKKENLVSGGIQIVAVDQNGSAPLDILDGIQFLKSGGFISLTGDRIWNKKQRTVPVDFLGHRVDLPEAPYLIALMSGAPLYVFFSSRSGKRDFLFSVSTPIYVKAGSRKDRKEAIRLSAQRYADLLEQNLRRYPFEWYHFESFLGQRKN